MADVELSTLGSVIKTAYESQSDTNAYTDAEKTKLAGVETSATADQTGSEIKIAYEGEADTNAFTDAEKSKLAAIEASADVTDATNVNAAGATMNTDTDVSGVSWVLDEDNMLSDDDTKVPTQQSVKAYVDGLVGAPEGTEILSTGEAGGNKFLREDGDGTSSWQSIPGGGDLLSTNNLSDLGNAGTARTNLGVAIGSDVQAYSAVLDATTASFTTADEAKLDAIEASADVTNATNVNAAGATMNTDSDVSSNSWVLDEDTMSSNDATKVPTQQSVKAYVDSNVGDSFAYTGIDTKTGNYVVLTSDSGKLIVCNSASALQITLPSSFDAVGDFFDVLNINTGLVTVTAGTAGINTAGNDTFTLTQHQGTRVSYASASDPKWRAVITTSQTLTANQYLAADSAGTSAEGRDDVGAITGSIITDADGTFTVAYKTPFAITIDDGDFQTLAGTCSVKVQDDGADITGFTSPVTQTTSNKNTSSGATVAANSTITIVISSASSLTGLNYSLNYTRTG